MGKLLLAIAAGAALLLLDASTCAATTPPFTKQCAPWLCNALITIDRYGNAQVDIDRNLLVYPPDGNIELPPVLIGVQNNSRSSVYNLHLESTDPNLWPPCSEPAGARQQINPTNITVVNIPTGTPQLVMPPLGTVHPSD
jgi:hypothetical protein